MASPRLLFHRHKHDTGVVIEGPTAVTKMQSVGTHDNSGFGREVKVALANGRNTAAEALRHREFPINNLCRSA